MTATGLNGAPDHAAQHIASQARPPTAPATPQPTLFVYCLPTEATILLKVRVWVPTRPTASRSILIPLRPRKAAEERYRFSGIPLRSVSPSRGFLLELSSIGGGPQDGFELYSSSSCPALNGHPQSFIKAFRVPPSGFHQATDGCLGIAASFKRTKSAA